MNLKSLAENFCKLCGCILEDADEIHNGICFVCAEDKSEMRCSIETKKD